jgi:hypothetical protein
VKGDIARPALNAAADLVANVSPVRVVRDEDIVVSIGALCVESVKNVAALLRECPEPKDPVRAR